MAQIIQHNIMALNSFNRLSTNNSLLSKNLEKLSSGYKINRAGDDAAGLAISEKMRAQITGLERASDNAQDGISLVQTAEGALTEVHSMLNRMVELATQSANGTYDGTDREKLQSEVKSLKDEIDRIATETNFNGIKLLDGSMANASVTKAMAGTAELSISIGSQLAGATFDIQEADLSSATVGYDSTNGGVWVSDDKSIKVTLTAAGGVTVNLDNTKAHTVSASKIENAVKTALAANEAAKNDGDDATKAAATTDAVVSSLSSLSIKGASITVAKDGSVTFGAIKTDGTLADGAVSYAANKAGAGNLNLQIGDTASQSISVSVDNMGTQNLGISDLDITTEENASAAIQTIKDAINQVSTQRSDLGAIQNRLEYTINNLATTTENLTSAESRIRDTDMAKEMMAYTKNNVLAQAAQAMLAQANQQPQQVLQLLQ